MTNETDPPKTVEDHNGAAGGSNNPPGGNDASGSQNQADVKASKDLENQTIVNRISVKAAPFNRDDPEIWFIQLETQFALAQIKTEDTKYNYLISSLDNATTAHVRPEILAPPTHNKYTALKKCIIERLCDSAKMKMDRLLSGLQLGDKKPSQLLREMQQLANNQLSDEVLKNLWLQRLPLHAQEIISCMENAATDVLATAADKIAEVQASKGIFMVASTSRAPPTDVTAQLKASIEALTSRFDKTLSSLKPAYNPNNKNTRRAESRSRNQSRQRSTKEAEKHPHCWFHHRFGSRAKNCRPPCTFTLTYRPAGSENE